MFKKAQYKMCSNDVTLLNSIYDLINKNIKNCNKIYDIDKSLYSKMIFDNPDIIPSNELGAFLQIQYLNNLISLSTIVLNHRIYSKLIELKYRIYSKYDKKVDNKLHDLYHIVTKESMESIYATKAISELFIREIKPFYKITNNDELFNQMDSLIEEHIQKYPECKTMYKSIENELKNKSKLNFIQKFCIIINAKIVQSKIFIKWFFSMSTLSFQETLKKYSMDELDDKKYIKTYTNIIDVLKYGLDRLNSNEVINVFNKYRKVLLYEYLSEENQKLLNLTNYDNVKDEEIDKFNDDLDRLEYELDNDLSNISFKIHDSVLKMYKYIMTGLFNVIYTYKISKK